MKITHIIQKPAPTPPNRVILDMTEQEASLLRLFCDYYAAVTVSDLVASTSRPDASLRAAAAARLKERLPSGKHNYPYDNYFVIEE